MSVIPAWLRMLADVPWQCTTTLVIARTDAEAADLVTSDVDANDQGFLTGERTIEGFYRTSPGLEQAVSRGLAYAEVADMVWCEPASRIWPSPRSSPMPSTPSFRASCWLTTARRASTGGRTSTTRPLPNFRRNSAPWATSSSSSRWPAFTA